MVRIVGAGLLLIASAALGFGAAGELNARVRSLEMLILSFEFMERELNAHFTPISELLERTSQVLKGDVKSFYLLCISGLDKQTEQPFSVVWGEAAEAAQLRITEAELEILAEIGAVLGRYDAATQSHALNKAQERLAVRLGEAREQMRTQGKLYRTLGITSGALLSILLL